MHVRVSATEISSLARSKRNPAFRDRTPLGESQVGARQSNGWIAKQGALLEEAVPIDPIDPVTYDEHRE
jgi:hypothetical protein